jgi:hypothetical protein
MSAPRASIISATSSLHSRYENQQRINSNVGADKPFRLLFGVQSLHGQFV